MKSETLLMPARFWVKVTPGRSDDECWPWDGGVDALGYGRFDLDGSRKAHRVAYELEVGVVPDGLVLDHVCRTRSCVNPRHLEPVTQAENVRRGTVSEVNRQRGEQRTHCKFGHSFDERNTYWTPAGVRQCRMCRDARQRNRRKNFVGAPFNEV